MQQEVSNYTNEQIRIVDLVRGYVSSRGYQWLYQKLLIDGHLWIFQFKRPDELRHARVLVFWDKLVQVLADGALTDEVKRAIDDELAGYAALFLANYQ